MKVFLGIGTNLGRRKANLKKAIGSISQKIGPVIKSSSVYETEPWGFSSENQFLNMVVEVETKLNPHEVLDAILSVEILLGRVRGEVQYISRIIDIDILFYEDRIIDEKNLKIPHPLMHERGFVLVPLCEIAPSVLHPVLKKTFAELLEVCGDRSKVKLYKK